MICHTFHTMQDIPLHCPPKPTFYGTATIGTKGQIVIPAAAREALNIHAGEKVIVMGLKEKGIVGICPVANLEAMFAHISDRLKGMQEVMEEVKNNTTKED